MDYRAPEGIEDTPLDNQRIWDNDPQRSREYALEAIRDGGFQGDCIRRRVGNYEAQVMAIRNGWVTWCPRSAKWLTSECGWKALEESGEKRPAMLPATDTWHDSRFCYLVRDTQVGEGRALRLFKECYPAEDRIGMHPALTREDVVCLRDYLNEWLEDEQS